MSARSTIAYTTSIQSPASQRGINRIALVLQRIQVFPEIPQTRHQEVQAHATYCHHRQVLHLYHR